MLAFVSLLVLLTSVTQEAAATPLHQLQQSPRRIMQSSLDADLDCVDPTLSLGTPVDEMTLIYPIPVGNAKATW